MHHDQNRGSKKRKLSKKNCHGHEGREKFINFAEENFPNLWKWEENMQYTSLAKLAVADKEIRLWGDIMWRDPDIRLRGGFNMFPSISRLFLLWGEHSLSL